jgi:hypothetical protein
MNIVTSKGKGKVVTVFFFLNSVQHHEGVLESGDIAPCILDFGISWR